MDTSLFASLSPELRNIIWEYTLTTPYSITLCNQQIFLPLTRTCRQIRHETLSMYLSLTSFNAHLDDGPVTPLATWLTTIGPARCLLLHELSVWDLHMLNGTLCGMEETERMLRCGGKDGEVFVLRSVGKLYHLWNWWLTELVIALRLMGLGLARFCEVGREARLTETSRFAVMGLDEVRGLKSAAVILPVDGCN